MAQFYKLEGKIAVPVDNDKYLRWIRTDLHQGHRVVASNELKNGEDLIRISTVFLFGINHAFGECAPLLFETRIFGGPLDLYQVRYSTWEQAESGHATALEELLLQMPGLIPIIKPREEYPTRFERVLMDD